MIIVVMVISGELYVFTLPVLVGNLGEMGFFTLPVIISYMVTFGELIVTLIPVLIK